MGLKKMLSTLSELLDPAVEKRKKTRKNIKEILKKLKSRENAIKEKLATTEDERKRDRLQKELDIIHSHRMKGVTAMRSDDEDSTEGKE